MNRWIVRNPLKYASFIFKLIIINRLRSSEIRQFYYQLNYNFLIAFYIKLLKKIKILNSFMIQMSFFFTDQANLLILIRSVWRLFVVQLV